MNGYDAMGADDRDIPRVGESVQIPENGLIIVPVRGVVAFPAAVFPLDIKREKSIAAIKCAIRNGQRVGIVMQRDPTDEDPNQDDLHRIGCICEILHFLESSPEGNHLICRGIRRFGLDLLERTTPFLVATVGELDGAAEIAPQTEAQFLYLRENAAHLLDLLPNAPVGLAETVREMTEPGDLADLAASLAETTPEENQDILETLDIDMRVKKASRVVHRRLEVLRVIDEIGARARESLEVRHRELILREQLAAILSELGEDESGKSAEVSQLSKAVATGSMPEDIKTQVLQEIKRYERLPDGATEATMLRTWLDWISELPWQAPADKPIDLAKARQILESEHFGLEKIKARIVQFLAVRKLAPTSKSPILCFVGPPGVGKTSLGQSIANAMGRPFARLSLGGVHSEAEIRGHRRTYVGALPGAIMQAIHRAGASNCVLMLDEIDKIGHGGGGDPAAALLEVLDTAQNNTFRDNYLGVEYDLSNITFLCTANMLEGTPRSLTDRMDIITLPGYTTEEKLEIARRHIMRRQLEVAGLSDAQIEISEAALLSIIRNYTREAGARGLERQIGVVLHHAAVEIAEGTRANLRVGANDLIKVLGAPTYENEVAMSVGLPGAATGLAWTPTGGDIMFVEASLVPGKGALLLTGQLGDVMRESAQTTLTLLKARAQGLGLERTIFAQTDIHVHVPAGATPKDGPSAGVAIFASLSSLFLERNLRSDTGMTGEISLRGLVLPVGGIREKVMAAASAGLTRVLLPARNFRDFDEIPASVRERLEFIWVDSVDDVLAEALEEMVPKKGQMIN